MTGTAEPGNQDVQYPLPALENLAVVYFGNDWFAENRTSSHHIAERLSQRAPILYVDCPGLRAPKASKRDMRKLFRKLVSAFRPPQPIGPGMWHMSVPQIPFRRLPLVARINLAAANLGNLQGVGRPLELGIVQPDESVEQIVPVARARRHGAVRGDELLVSPCPLDCGR